MRAITDIEESHEAFSELERVVSKGAASLQRVIGHRYRSSMGELLWHDRLRLWASLQPERQPDRFWCAFGIEDPYTLRSVGITCEINPPKSGINRRCGGLFISDDCDAIHVAHSGKIGGGRTGVGKSAFIDFHSRHGRNAPQAVTFPDGKTLDYIVIGRLDDAEFMKRLATFVHDIARSFCLSRE